MPVEIETSPVGLGPKGGESVPRRTVMRRVARVTLAVAAVPAAALAAREFHGPRDNPQHDNPQHDDMKHDDMKGEAAGDFEETYRGRHIRGALADGVSTRAHAAHGAAPWDVTVDGRPLHLMRRADGSYLSMVDHYQSFPTPLAAARGAVDELGDQALRRHPL